MKKTAKFLWACTLLVVSGSLFANTELIAAEKEAVYKGKIAVGTAIWPGYMGLYVAQEKGYFKQAGLDVDVKAYIGLTEVSQDYVAGKLQGRADLTLDAVKERQEGLDHRIVMAIDYSNGSDVILAKPDILSLQDIKGKRVAYEAGTLEEFFLKWALSENGMQISDIIGTNANPEDAARLLIEGQVDVAVSYEPFASKAISAGFKKVYSSADAPGLITDVLVFRSDFINAYPGAVHAFIGAYFKALDFSEAHPEEAHTITAKWLNDTPEGIARQLTGVKMLGRSANETAFTFSTGLQSLYGNLRQIAAFLRADKGDGARPMDTDILVERKFIKALHEPA